MLDFSVNGGSSKSWRIMCRVYYCFLTVLMLRAAWELQHHLSKGGKINEEHPDMQVINEWLQRLRDQVHHSKADSARKLIQDVMKLEEDWKKYNANRSTVRFPPEYAGAWYSREACLLHAPSLLGSMLVCLHRSLHLLAAPAAEIHPAGDLPSLEACYTAVSHRARQICLAKQQMLLQSSSLPLTMGKLHVLAGSLPGRHPLLLLCVLQAAKCTRR
jgi:hypothetical protein